MNEPRKYLCLQNPNHGEFVALDNGVQQHCPKCGYAADSIKGRFVWRPSKVVLMLAMFFVLAVSAQAQDCPSGFQCVPQAQFNTILNRLEQLVEAKDTINKMFAERGASDAAINSAIKVIDGWKQLDAINNTIILKQRDVINLMEKTLNLYASMVEKLEARLNAPKSAWSKFLSALKTVTTLAAGIMLGRGL